MDIPRRLGVHASAMVLEEGVVTVAPPLRHRSGWRGSSKLGDRNLTFRGEALAVQLDALDLMKRVRREIALSAVRTTHHGHILDHEQVLADPVATRQMPSPDAFLSADIALHRQNVLCLLNEDCDNDKLLGDAQLGHDRNAVSGRFQPHHQRFV